MLTCGPRSPWDARITSVTASTTRGLVRLKASYLKAKHFMIPRILIKSVETIYDLLTAASKHVKLSAQINQKGRPLSK